MTTIAPPIVALGSSQNDTIEWSVSVPRASKRALGPTVTVEGHLAFEVPGGRRLELTLT